MLDSDASELLRAAAVAEQEQAAATPPTTTTTTAAAVLPKRRNQYNLEFKLAVASQYVPGVFGRGFEALARRYGLNKSNVMSWVAKKELMTELLAAKGSGAARQAYRLEGCGRKSTHAALEDELEQWMQLQLASGERVRDKDIKEQATRIFLATHPGVTPDDENMFKASSGWLARFKQRKNIPVRRMSKGGDSHDDELADARAAAVAASNAIASLAPDALALTDAPLAPSSGAESESERAVSPTTVAAHPGAPSRRNGAVGAKRPATDAATDVPPNAEASAVPSAWMASVDKRLGDLTHKLEAVLTGQTLLLEMLQRLAPLAHQTMTAPPVAASGSTMTPSAPVSTQAAAAGGEEGSETDSLGDDNSEVEMQHALDKAPATKRRRLSTNDH